MTCSNRETGECHNLAAQDAGRKRSRGPVSLNSRNSAFAAFAAVCVVALSGCGQVLGDQVRSTILVRNECGYDVSVAIRDGADPRGEDNWRDYLLNTVQPGDAAGSSSNSKSGEYYVLVLETRDDGEMHIVPYTRDNLDPVFVLEGDLCPPESL